MRTIRTTTARSPYSVSFRRTCVAFALLLAAGLTACGDDASDNGGGGGGGGGGGQAGTSCAANADCASGLICVTATSGATLTLDEGDAYKQGGEACFEACAAACDFDDFDCLDQCSLDCNLTCEQTCAVACEGDGQCYSECLDFCDGGGPDDPDVGGPGPDVGGPGPDVGGGGGGGGGGGQGICRAQPTGPGPDAGGGDTGGNADVSEPEPINWAGTWSAHAVYAATCQWSSLGAERTANIDERITVQLTGSGNSFEAVFDNDSSYTMTGPGSATRLTLSGQFPGRDDNDRAATTVMRDNNVDIVLDNISTNDLASGSLAGTYETSGGTSCTIQSGGSIELSR